MNITRWNRIIMLPGCYYQRSSCYRCRECIRYIRLRTGFDQGECLHLILRDYRSFQNVIICLIKEYHHT